MGVVYRAHDSELGRDVALKLVTPGAAEADTHGRARLLREAQALAQLSHPNVIAVYDVGHYEAGVFLAMELVEGQRIDEWLKATRRDWREIVRVFRDAGRGLQAAHDVGLVHRDIKPANLMLGADGRVRVLDFGLARPAGESSLSTGEPASVTPRPRIPIAEDAPTSSGSTAEQRPPRSRTTRAPSLEESPAKAAPAPEPSAPGSPLSTPTSSPSLLSSPVTQAGAIIGTPPYMAPEQHAGQVGDVRSDQFSFCVSFYQALYGERPFGGATSQELEHNMRAGRVRAAPAGARVPAFLRQILLRGLQSDPVRRWSSMNALLEALGRDPALRWRRLGTFAGVAVLAVTAAFGLWRGTHAGRACDGGNTLVRSVWDPARKAQVRARFLSTGKPYAAGVVGHAHRRVRGHARARRAIDGAARPAHGVPAAAPR
jgi:serine/threonine protein kinase